VEDTILVPIDFSEQSLIALDQAYNLARSSQLSLSIMTVVKTNSNFWGIFSDNEKKDLEFKIEQKLKTLAKELSQKADVDVHTIIRRGKVIEEIMRVSEHLTPRMIVMGTSPGNHIATKIIGSRALQIIKTSTFPVLSIKGKSHTNGCENILLPIDSTKHTEQKVHLAIEMAKVFKSKITILTAIDKNNPVAIETVNQKFEIIKKEIDSHSIPCETGYLYTESDRSLMALSILAYAHRVQADLIVIMTQQENSINKFFLGSLAQNIIFSSDIPVLTLNPKIN